MAVVRMLARDALPHPFVEVLVFARVHPPPELCNSAEFKTGFPGCHGQFLEIRKGLLFLKSEQAGEQPEKFRPRILPAASASFSENPVGVLSGSS